MRSLKFWPNQWLYLAFFVVAMDVMMTVRKFYFINVICSGAFSIIFADICVRAYEVFIYKRKFLEDANKKAVLVTGCGSGFGFLIAKKLANMGYLVYAAVHNPDCEGAKTLQTLDNIVVLGLEVTDQASVDKTVEFVKADLKRRGDRVFWSLVNNAGRIVFSDVEFASLDHYQSLMDVNAFGAVRMCKSFLPLLRAAGGGRIVNVGSSSSHTTPHCMTGYSMSKHALAAFANGLRLEMKPWNISVHNVDPPTYESPPNWAEKVELIKDRYMKLWRSGPAEVKEAYGESYRNAYIKSYLEFAAKLTNPKEKLHEVIDDVTHAVAGTDPNVQYIPSTMGKVGLKLLSIFPQEVGDIFLIPKITELPAGVKKARMDDRRKS